MVTIFTISIYFLCKTWYTIESYQIFFITRRFIMFSAEQYEDFLIESKGIIFEWPKAIEKLKASISKLHADSRSNVEHFMMEDHISSTLEEILLGLTILRERLAEFYSEQKEHLELLIDRRNRLSKCFEISKVIYYQLNNNQPMEKIRYDLYVKFGEEVEDFLTHELQQMIFETRNEDDYQEAKEHFSQLAPDFTHNGKYSTIQKEINHTRTRIHEIKKTANTLLLFMKEIEKLQEELY